MRVHELPGSRPLADAFAREARSRGERPIRYRLLGGKVGVPRLRAYLRTWVGVALWLTWPVALARVLGRLGARPSLHRLERWWARRVTRHLDVRLRIDGLEHLDPGVAYVVTPLHEGFADALALFQLPLDLRFAARDELFEWRLLGPLLRDTGQLYVSPERGAWSYRRLRRVVGPILDGGESVVLFPQGGILGIETDFLGGPFALARTLGRPILPIALTGGAGVWEYPYTPRLRFGAPMSLRILPPIGTDEVAARSVEELRQIVMCSLKAAALSGQLAPPRRFVPARDGYWDGYAYAIDPAFPALAADVARRRAAPRPPPE